jgi:hypothetical protein
MTAEQAQKILKDWIQPDGTIEHPFEYFGWRPESHTMEIEGVFPADELEAIAWWIRNAQKPTAE